MHSASNFLPLFETERQDRSERADHASGAVSSEVTRRTSRLAFGPHSQAVQLCLDAFVFAVSLALACLIRNDGISTGVLVAQFLFWLPVLVAARLLVNSVCGVYRFIWRFVCLPDAISIGRSLGTVTAVLLVLRFFYPAAAPFADVLRLPLGIIALEFFQSLLLALGIRSASRIVHERGDRASSLHGESPKRVVLYGAGRAGFLLVGELSQQTGIDIAGFVDDDPAKRNTCVAGLAVLGSGESLEEIVRRHRVGEVIISMAAASPVVLSGIVARCKRIPIPVKIIPSVNEILSKPAAISHIREIRMEDLLGRDTVSVESLNDEVRQAYRDKRILVTGAGGSIGSELTRQLLLLRPRKISILDKDENSIYDLEQELKFRNPDIPVEPLIADIKLRESVFAVFADSRPEVVFHAAAHKHVPLMEKHPCEAVLNNIMGTKNVVEACGLFAVGRLIFISTDKAVNPTNVMGATKRVGEGLVTSFADSGRIRAACVRFGNVMGSRGSVIPLFQKQIEKGGPVTVTHPDIVRFFMTIPEAVQLVLCAGSMADRGDVFVLDMGCQRRILDLAREMIVLCGLEPGKDIEIAFTGLRPGEKMNEELVGTGEAVLPTRFDKITSIRHQPFDQKLFREHIGQIIKSAQRNDRQAIYDLFLRMHLGYAPAALVREEPVHIPELVTAAP